MVLSIDETITKLNRDDLVQILWAENILARRYFYPGCHHSEPYATLFPSSPRLPNTEKLCRELITLPTGTGVTNADINIICQLIKFILDNAEVIQEKKETIRNFSLKKAFI